MDTFARLGVVIDPSGVQSGGQIVTNVLVGIVNQAKQVEAATGSLGTAFKAFSLVMRTVSDTINIVRAGFDALKGAWNWISGFVDAGAQVDTFRAKFGGLLGDYGKANAVLAQLRTFSTANPISFGDLAQSALDLAKATNGLGQGAAGMNSVVSLTERIAQAAPENLGEATQAFAKLYEAMQSGERIEMPVRQLVQMHVLTGDVLTDLDRMNQKGTTVGQMWATVGRALDQNAGNAARYGSTYEGLIEMLGNAADLAKQSFGEPLAISLKQPVADLTKLLIAADGPAASFGKMLADQVQVFYGAWKNGELGAYVMAEFDRAMAYVNGLLHKYLLDPIAGAGFGEAFSQTFSNLGQVLKAAFDDGVSSFRAGMQVALGDLDNMFTRLANRLATFVNGAFGTSFDQTPEVVHPTYRAYKTDDSQGDTKAPDSAFAPLGAAFLKLAINLATLGDAAGKAQGSLSDFAGAQTTAAAGLPDLNRWQYLTLGTGAPTPATDSRLGSNFNQYTSLGGGSNTNPMPVSVVNISSAAGQAITGTGTVFGRNMDGSIDRTDERYMSYSDAHTGAGSANLLDPALQGAAVTPQQASLLTGISDNAAAMKALMNQFITVTDLLTGKASSVQVVDQGPNRNTGVHIEMTPAAMRAVGNTSGNDPLSASYGSQSAADAAAGIRARALMTNPGIVLAPAGPGSLTQVNDLAKMIKDAENELAKFGLTEQQTASTAGSVYNASLKDLNTLLGNNVISQGQYNSMLDKAQEKLYTSGAAYDVLKNSIGEAAAKQAELNANLAHMKTQVDLGNASPGQSLSYGAQAWMQQQGNSQQQYSKLMGGSLDALTSDSANFFSTWQSGSQSASQAFRAFGSSVMSDIAKMIEKMLILRAAQTAIGFASSFGGSMSSGISDGGGGYFSNDEVDDIIGAADVGTQHTGGTIGYGSFGSTSVSPLAFVGAPRYHMGGMLGLQPDEVPIVGLRGERVLNRTETAAYNRGAGTPIVHSPTYNVTIQASDDDPAKELARVQVASQISKKTFYEELAKSQKYGQRLNPR